MKEFILSQSWDVLVSGMYFIIWGIAYGFKNTVVRILNLFASIDGHQSFLGKMGDSLFYVSAMWLIISFV